MTEPRPAPLWQTIARALRSAIAEGHYPEGSKLPPEAALAKRFGVNRHTVRHAIGALAEDGLVHSRRGAGTFVLAQPLDYPLSDRVRFHQNLREAGRMARREMLSIELRAASEREARRLRLTSGAEICVTHTISFADETPVALAESHFPEIRLPGIAAALRESEGVTDALAAVGVADYVRSETRLWAAVADASQAAHLRLRTGAPLLVTSSMNVAEGWPVQYGRTWFASDRITLTLEH
ncbi:MAG: phosphonate metabolism transcriptional regulator PhnF [Pseudomonadota bacterium]